MTVTPKYDPEDIAFLGIPTRGYRSLLILMSTREDPGVLPSDTPASSGYGAMQIGI